MTLEQKEPYHHSRSWLVGMWQQELCLSSQIANSGTSAVQYTAPIIIIEPLPVPILTSWPAVYTWICGKMLISAGKMLIYEHTNILVDEVIVIWATIGLQLRKP